MAINDQIQQANQRLKSANVNLVIELSGSKLRLRGTLPLKTGDEKRQQRIPLDISATLDGLKQAEGEAHVIRRDLDASRFTWDKYIKPKQESETLLPKIIKEWIEAFEADYFSKRKRVEQSLATWKGDYFQTFKHLPQNQQLTIEVIKKCILSTEPDTKTRKRYCTCLDALARFANINLDTKALSGKYSPKRVRPRDIPSDADIAHWYYQIKNPAWQWVFGILATYGLRNHEVFRIDFDQLRSGNRILHVLGGKTGARRVWAYFPEWFDTFNLSTVILPQANLKRTNIELGNNITHYFARHKLPFSAYDLRHAWAIRTLEFGLDVSLASQQMGHSLAVHSETYHHWISDGRHQHAYDLLIARSECPKPPLVT